MEGGRFEKGKFGPSPKQHDTITIKVELEGYDEVKATSRVIHPDQQRLDV